MECVDVLNYADDWFRRGYSATYLLLVRHFSWVWRISYGLMDAGVVYALIQPLRRCWNLWIARRFARVLEQDPPTAIIVTHFLPADVCGALISQGRLRCPTIVVVTDLYAHRFWLAREPQAVVVATPEGAEWCAKRGIRRERLSVIGIPVRRVHGTEASGEPLAQRLGLTGSRRTALMTSGGTTVGRFEAVAEALMDLERSLPGRLQLLVVCGEDQETRDRLQARARMSGMPVQVFGFVDNVPELMALSDLVVAKAGGLTVTEALGQGKPLVLYHVIPGQERANAAYVESRGAAVIARSPEAAAQAVARCVSDPAALEAMRLAASRLGRPDAADQILREVVKPLVEAGAGR